MLIPLQRRAMMPAAVLIIALCISIFANFATCLAQGLRGFYAVEPMPIANLAEQGETTPDPCSNPLVDAPLSALSVATQPIVRPSQIEFNPNDTPQVCPAPVLANVPTVYVGTRPTTAARWPVWPGAQFCHRPLYFEERALERCGCVQGCQPTRSAVQFLCNAALFPGRFCCQYGTCQCTPPAF